MVYRVTKTVGGHRYIYEQRSWREGRRVRTESQYIGPVGAQPKRRRTPGPKIADLIRANTTRHPDDLFTEEMLAQYNARVEQEEQARLAKLDDLYAKYGLHLASDRPELRAAAVRASAAAPCPETPEPVEQNVEQTSEPTAEEGSSAEEGQETDENAPDGAQSS